MAGHPSKHFQSGKAAERPLPDFLGQTWEVYRLFIHGYEELPPLSAAPACGRRPLCAHPGRPLLPGRQRALEDLLRSSGRYVLVIGNSLHLGGVDLPFDVSLSRKSIRKTSWRGLKTPADRRSQEGEVSVR